MFLAPTLFGIFFALLLRHAFLDSSEGVLLPSRSDGKVFNITCLRAKTIIREVLLRDLLFVDDAAFVTHSEKQLQRLQGLRTHHQPQYNTNFDVKLHVHTCSDPSVWSEQV